MSEFNFPNTDSFFVLIQDKNIDIQKKRYNLRLYLKDASAEINAKFGSMTSSEKLTNGRGILDVINKINSVLKDEDETEKEYLISIEQLVSSLIPKPYALKKNKSKYQEVFRENRLDYFKSILEYLNKLSDGKLRRGYLAVVGAIRDYEKELEEDGKYDKKIFKYKVTNEEIVNMLNTEFDANINYNSKWKFSDGSKHIGRVRFYYAEFPFI